MRLAIAGIMLAWAALGALPAQSQTLRQAVEGAWAINPQIASLTAKRDAIAARLPAARAWFAGPPAISLSHATDQVIQNKQARATEGELSVPLWLPGEGTATERVIDAELLRNDAQLAEAKLKIAGEVREALYALANAQAELGVAAQRMQSARALEADVARRQQAGDVAALEHDLARAELLDAEAKAREKRSDVATAETSLQALTGFKVPLKSLDEPLRPDVDTAAHPRIQNAARSIDAARAALHLAQTATRDSPEVSVLANRNRDIRGTEYDTMVGVRLKVPFATEARNAPRLAAAQADLLTAQAEYASAQRQILAELTSARQTLLGAQDQAPIIAARVQSARQAVARLRRSYDAGEIGLSELLRGRVALYDAEAANAANRIGIARARARVNQAAGLVP